MTPYLLLLAGSLACGAAAALGCPVLAGALDQLGRTRVADLEDRLRHLGMDAGRMALYRRLWLAAVAGSFPFVWLALGMPVLAPVVALLVYGSARPALAYLADARRARIEDQLVTAARALADQARAGLALPQGLAAVSKEVPDPLGRELRRAALEYDQGGPFPEVLAALKDRLRLDGLTLFVTAVLVCQARGGNLAPALDRIAHSLEELRRVERKRESDTAGGRLLVTVLGLFPAAFLGLFYLIDSEGTALVFTTSVGQAVLGLAGLLVYGGVRWARFIVASVE